MREHLSISLSEGRTYLLRLLAAERGIRFAEMMRQIIDKALKDAGKLKANGSNHPTGAQPGEEAQ